jgi:hypothetical protein
MLDHKQFTAIMNKKDLTIVELILIEDHLRYIEDIHNEYEDSLPIDVHASLMNDLNGIVDRLTIEYNKLRARRIKLDIV